jgi:hypothetical protein
MQKKTKKFSIHTAWTHFLSFVTDLPRALS